MPFANSSISFEIYIVEWSRNGFEAVQTYLRFQQVSTFKFLGVLINDTLTWNNHIDQLVGKILAVLVSSGIFLGFSLTLRLFFTSNLTSFPWSIIVMWFRLAAPKGTQVGSRLFSTMLVGSVFIALVSTLLLLYGMN